MYEQMIFLQELTRPWWPAIMAGSLAMAAVSLLLMPWLLIQLPADHFVRLPHTTGRRSVRSLLLRLLRNLLALLLVLAGFLMLFLPGQGLLTLLLGLVMADLPGKQSLERDLMRRPAVFRGANWIRKRYHRAPFVHPDDAPDRT